MLGVYRFTNMANNKKYIGISRNLTARKHAHYSMLKRNIHKNKHLQAAWNKYGEGSFKYEILLESNNIDILKLEELEKRLIVFNDLNNLYNKCIGKGIHIADSEFRNNCRRLFYNNKNLLDSKEKKKVSVKLIHVKTDEVLTFNSVAEAARYIKGDPATISKVLSKKYKHFNSTKGYRVEKIDNK